MVEWEESGAWYVRVGGVRGRGMAEWEGTAQVLLAIFTTAVGRPELNIRISVQRPKNSRRSSGLQSRDSSVSFVFILFIVV